MSKTKEQMIREDIKAEYGYDGVDDAYFYDQHLEKLQKQAKQKVGKKLVKVNFLHILFTK